MACILYPFVVSQSFSTDVYDQNNDNKVMAYEFVEMIVCKPRPIKTAQQNKPTRLL